MFNEKNFNYDFNNIMYMFICIFATKTLVFADEVSGETPIGNKRVNTRK